MAELKGNYEVLPKCFVSYNNGSALLTEMWAWSISIVHCSESQNIMIIDYSQIEIIIHERLKDSYFVYNFTDTEGFSIEILNQ